MFDSATLGSNDSVRDFSQAQGDKLVLDTILIGFTAGVSDIDDFVKLATSATGMTLRVDLDGAGGAHNFQNIAFIKGASGLVVQDMYDGGSLVVL